MPPTHEFEELLLISTGILPLRRAILSILSPNFWHITLLLKCAVRLWCLQLYIILILEYVHTVSLL